jgi:hypothetical protein
MKVCELKVTLAVLEVPAGGSLPDLDPEEVVYAMVTITRPNIKKLE